MALGASSRRDSAAGRCAECGRENTPDARFCNQCGAVLAVFGAPAEQRKTVSVVFCDIAGSTALGERLDAEALRNRLAEYYDAMRALVERHGGMVAKFIGDAVVGVFGVPSLHEDDALRAVRAASEMSMELSRRRIPARIGINTGEVVTGGEALVTGDAVNVAARLEQAAATGEVLIGAATFELVRNAIVAEPVEPINAKGKREPVQAWRVVHVDPAAAGFARAMDAPLVGRQSELDLIDGAFERARRERRCHLVTVLGFAGMGKSRLVSEFASLRAADARVLRGHCLSYGEGITYWPLAELLREAASIDDTDDVTAARTKLHALVATAVDRERGLVAERLGSAVGLGDDRVDSGEVAWATRRLLEGLAFNRPVVVVFEDVHWAEQQLLDLVDALTSLSRGGPLLVLCTARPELLDRVRHWGGGKTNAASILLQPLDPSDTRRLIDSRPEVQRIPLRLRDQITSASEGNPLFAEQMVATLSERGPDGDHPVPSTIQALLAARIDSLAADERAILGAASVEGRVFRPSMVAQMTERPHGAVSAALERLTRRELVMPEWTIGGDETMRFQHQLVRDAAYAALPKRERAALHERFAEALGGRARDRAGEFEEIIGHHLAEACLLREDVEPGGGALSSDTARRAGEMLAVAGRRALGRNDSGAAVHQLTRAIRFAADHRDRCLLLLDLSEAYQWDMRYSEAIEAAEQALDLASRCGEEALAVRSRLLVVAAEAERDTRFDRLDAHLDPWIDRLVELGDEWGSCLGWELRMNVQMSLCRAEDAITAAERALGYARRSGRRNLELRVLDVIAGQAMLGPMPVADALALCREMYEEHADVPAFRATLLSRIGLLQAMKGDLAGAREIGSQANAIDADLGTRVDRLFQAQSWAWLYRLLGDPESAEAALRASIEGLDESSHMRLINRDMIAHLLVVQGRFDEADELAELSRTSAAFPSAAFEGDWRRVRARVLAHRGAYAPAVELAREGVELIRRTDYLDEIAWAYRDLAIVLGAAGDRAGALEAVQTALTLWEQKGNRTADHAARGEFAALLGASAPTESRSTARK